MKLKCNAIQRFISDYIDGTLSASDTTKVETHLQFCVRCQREVNAFKKTRGLVVDFYVEPEAPDSYFRQFEVELHRCIENKGPTPLNQRIRTSIAQFGWCLLTQLRQSFNRYSFIRRNVVPLCVLLLLMVTGFVATHLLNQESSAPPTAYSDGGQKQTFFGESIVNDEKTEFPHSVYNKRETKRKVSGGVSPPTPAANTEKVGYWKLSEPLTTETEGHIIVVHLISDRSVPSDTADSELTVSAQPDILGIKSPLQDNSDAALPLELEVTSFFDKYQRKHRRLSGFIAKVMHVPSEILIVPGLYDLNEL